MLFNEPTNMISRPNLVQTILLSVNNDSVYGPGRVATQGAAMDWHFHALSQMIASETQNTHRNTCNALRIFITK